MYIKLSLKSSHGSARLQMDGSSHCTETSGYLEINYLGCLEKEDDDIMHRGK